MKTTLLLGAVITFAIGCAFGHSYHAQLNYDRAWKAGNSNGWSSAMAHAETLAKDEAEARKHFYNDLRYADGCDTNIPAKYQQLDERLAWFYGCAHLIPPTTAETQANLASLAPEKQAMLRRQLIAARSYDITTVEGLIGVAFGELPLQVFPPK